MLTKRLPIALLICLVLAVFENLVAADPCVKTNLGSVQGLYKTSQHDRQYAAYLGIPYAESTSGERRFEVKSLQK